MTNRVPASWIAAIALAMACGARTPLAIDGLANGGGTDGNGANGGGANGDGSGGTGSGGGDDGGGVNGGDDGSTSSNEGGSDHVTGSPIATGTAHTCVVTRNGTVKCWGYGLNGQLGDGNGNSSALPVAAQRLDRGVIGLAATDEHTCAITAPGGVECWGHNYFGELGDGTADSFVPTRVTGLSSGVIEITAGDYDSCAVTRDHVGWCWGQNRDGQLGDGTTASVASPVSTLASQLVAIAAGSVHTCGLSTAGGVKCWGDNTFAELGDGTGTNSFEPVDVVGLASGVAAISVGGRHTCALMQTGGVKCWGDNRTGALGTGTLRSELTPLDVLGLDAPAIAIATSDSHTCAVMNDASVRCWGANERGQLGDGTKIARYSPVRVVGLPPTAAVAPGALHTCAVVEDRSVRCWGSNEFGQLGNGGNGDSSVPVAVVGL